MHQAVLAQFNEQPPLPTNSGTRVVIIDLERRKIPENTPPFTPVITEELKPMMSVGGYDAFWSVYMTLFHSTMHDISPPFSTMSHTFPPMCSS